MYIHQPPPGWKIPGKRGKSPISSSCGSSWLWRLHIPEQPSSSPVYGVSISLSCGSSLHLFHKALRQVKITYNDRTISQNIIFFAFDNFESYNEWNYLYISPRLGGSSRQAIALLSFSYQCETTVALLCLLSGNCTFVLGGFVVYSVTFRCC